MSKAGSRILEGAREALAVAKGEAPAASITVNGHRYVPADRIEALEREVEELRANVIEECAQIADEHALQCSSKINKKRSDHDLAVFESAASEAMSIAASIRLHRGRDAMSDLIERLRKMASLETSALFSQRKTLNAAADRITALENENAELRKALEPFANSDMAPDIYDDDSCVAGSCDFTCSDLRRARYTMEDIHREQLARPRIKPSESEGREG